MHSTIKNLIHILCLLLLFTGHLHCLAAPVFMDGRIIRVVDGDTVALQDESGVIHKIRLAGIDAPESRQPFGPEATIFLRGLVLGKQVKALAYKKDRYGRTIATIFFKGQDVNFAIIDAGFAWHYKRYAKEQPAAEAMAYAHGESLAHQNKFALWSDEEPIAPWEWRVAHPQWRSGLTKLSLKTQSSY
jgi:endonuclease YncB( thermonuclease family)